MTKLTQYQANQAGNACILQDSRLSQWDRDFICSLIDRKLLDNVNNLSEKQKESVLRIAQAVHDVPGI